MKHEDSVRGFVAACLAVALILGAGYWNIWSDPKAWVASLVFNLATTGLAVFYINLVLAKRDARARKERRRRHQKRRQQEAQVASYIMTNIMMGCFEAALTAAKSSPGEWLAAMDRCHDSLNNAIHSIRYRLTLPGVWSVKTHLHLSQVLLYLEAIVAEEWTVKSFVTFKHYLSLILGDISDVAMLTRDARLEEQVKKCEGLLGWPGASRGDLDRAIERISPKSQE